MKIYFDLDDVGNNLGETMLKRYNKDFNDNYNWRDLENNTWADNEGVKVDDDYFVNLLCSKGAFLNVDARPGYIEIIKRLIDEKYDVRILTQPEWKSKYCMSDKVEWIKKHLPFFDLGNIIMTKLKGEVSGKGKILIDDNPEQLKQWEENGGIGIAFVNSRYSERWSGYKAYTFEEVYNLIKEIEKNNK
jgi:5'(3')-deoxyribonucleotidase